VGRFLFCGCKGKTFSFYPPKLLTYFFSSPLGFFVCHRCSSKAGAKVVSNKIQTKYFGNFFHKKDEIFSN